MPTYLISATTDAARTQRVIVQDAIKGTELTFKNAPFSLEEVSSPQQPIIAVKSSYGGKPWTNSSIKSEKSGDTTTWRSDDVGDDGVSDGDYNDCVVTVKLKS